MVFPGTGTNRSRDRIGFFPILWESQERRERKRPWVSLGPEVARTRMTVTAETEVERTIKRDPRRLNNGMLLESFI